MAGSPRETPHAPTIPSRGRESPDRYVPESWLLTPFPISCETDRRPALNVTVTSSNRDGPGIWPPGAAIISRSKDGPNDPSGEGVMANPSRRPPLPDFCEADVSAGDGLFYTGRSPTRDIDP